MKIGISFAICSSSSFEFWMSGMISKRNWLALRTMSMTISALELLRSSASYCTCRTCSCYVLRHDSSPANNCIMQSTKAPMVMRFSTTIVCISMSSAYSFDCNGTLKEGWRVEEPVEAGKPGCCMAAPPSAPMVAPPGLRLTCSLPCYRSTSVW